MTPEEKNMLARTLKLSQDNNDLLTKMNRRARNAHIFQIFYWVIIIGLSLGAYYIIQPYVNWAVSEFRGASAAQAAGAISTSTASQSEIRTLEDVFNSFKNR